MSRSAASDHLVGGVDFVFAVALAQGVLLFRPFWTDPLDPDYLTVALALVAVYVMTLQSFVDWHLAMQRNPYLVDWDLPGRERMFERLRFAVDVLIVLTYAFIVVNAVPLMEDPGASLDVYLAGYPAAFGLFFVWAALRKRRYPHAASAVPMAALFGLFAAFYAVYRLDLLEPGANTNNVFLVSVLVLTMLSRLSNTFQRYRST